MKYVPGPSHGQFSGSQGNTTASHNRFGAYLRGRTIPVNPRTAEQVNVRTRFTDIATLWRALTESQRTDWSNLGAQMSRVDSLGVTYFLTGLQAFISVNQRRLAAGLGTVNDAPPLGSVGTIDNLTATFDIGLGGVHQLAFTGTVGLNDRLYIFATPPVSAGRNFFGDKEHRLILVTPPGPVSPVNIQNEYNARFPGANAGQKVSYRVLLVNQDFVNLSELTTQTIVAQS